MPEDDLIKLSEDDKPGSQWLGVIDFWFGAPGSPERGELRPVWWGKDENIDSAAFDAEIRERFQPLHESALKGELDHWIETPAAALALVICLDQFPRNIFRKSARAFGGDAKALEVAKAAISKGYEADMCDTARQFFYMPFEHSEDLAEQRRSVELFTALRGPDDVEFAQHHYDIIARFGRFPHRNEALDRESTAEEIAYSENPENRFGQ